MTQIAGLPTLVTSGNQPKERRWLKVFLTFIEQLRIQSKEVSSDDPRGAPLKLWGSQRMFLDEICEGMERGIREFYALKSRQLGCTTISLAIDLFWLAAYPGIVGCLIADTETNRNVFRQTLKRYHESLPEEFIGDDFKIKKNNEDYMLFRSGSRLDMIVAGTKKKNWGEGRGYTFCHSTETAAYGTPEGISSFRETLAEAHPNRLFIFESTAKGKNTWYRMYQEGLRDTFTKKSFFIGWWSKELNSIARSDQRFRIYGTQPPNKDERELMDAVEKEAGIRVSMEQLAWYRARSADTSTSKNDLDQNQPWIAAQAFVQSGFSYFPMRVLEKLMDVIYDQNGGIGFAGYRFWLGDTFAMSRMDPIGEGGSIEDVELRVWEEPVDEGTYVIGCDPAYGRNDWKDRHSVQVFRCFADRLVQVAEYADNRVETYQAAWVLAYLAGVYKNCIVNIELTGGPGRAVFRELDSMRTTMRAEMNRKLREERDWDDFLQNASWYLWHRPDSMGAGYAYHTEMSQRTKGQVLNSFRDSLMYGALIVRSGPLVEEMARVIQDGGEIGAPNQEKDDRVFAAVLAHMAWNDWVRASMIQRGATYEEVMQSEAGKAQDPKTIVVKHHVANFWRKRVAELEQEPEPTPLRQFMEQRGLE